MSINDIPDEVLVEILQYIPLRQLWFIEIVSKRFYNIMRNSFYVWRKAFDTTTLWNWPSQPTDWIDYGDLEYHEFITAIETKKTDQPVDWNIFTTGLNIADLREFITVVETRQILLQLLQSSTVAFRLKSDESILLPIEATLENVSIEFKSPTINYTIKGTLTYTLAKVHTSTLDIELPGCLYYEPEEQSDSWWCIIRADIRKTYTDDIGSDVTALDLMRIVNEPVAVLMLANLFPIGLRPFQLGFALVAKNYYDSRAQCCPYVILESLLRTAIDDQDEDLIITLRNLVLLGKSPNPHCNHSETYTAIVKRRAEIKDTVREEIKNKKQRVIKHRKVE
jgi:hypothetical protein